jgi:hypothetical protein
VGRINSRLHFSLAHHWSPLFRGGSGASSRCLIFLSGTVAAVVMLLPSFSCVYRKNNYIIAILK